MNITVTELQVRESRSRRVNWGSKGRIRLLCVHGKKELWQILSSQLGSRLFPSYVPGEVLLVPDGEKYWQSYDCPGIITLNRANSRVSHKFFKLHAATIDKFFGIAVADKLQRGKTVVIA
jgi:hypothetical protein